MQAQFSSRRDLRRRCAVEPLEPRRLLAVTPVDPADAIPFTKYVLDPNTGRRALEKNIADIDGDGRADAVLGFSTGGGNVGGIFWYAFPTNGVVSGAWTKYTIVGSGDGYEDLLIQDVNHDGAVDVIASISATVKWFENPRGKGKNPRTDTWTAHNIGNATGHDMAIGDFDLDGKIDVATNAAIYFQNTGDSWTTVAGALYNRGGVGVATLDIGEGPRQFLRTGGQPIGTFDPKVRALNLIGSGPSTTPRAIYWYENPILTGGNPRTQTWVRHYVGPVFDPNWNTVGYCFESMDVNGDGRVDIITAQGEQPDDFAPPPPEGLAWWQAPANRRTGTWIRHQIDINIVKIHRIRVVDMNLDGRKDLLIGEQEQSSQDRLAILFQDDVAGNNWKIQVLSTGSAHNQFAADIDGDGDLDVLNSAHGVYGGNPEIQMWVNGLRTPAATAPIITANPQSRTTTAGNSVTFFVGSKGATPLSFQWKRNGTNISGATSPSYTLSNPTSADNNAQFACVVSNSINSATSAAAILTVASAAFTYVSDLNPTFNTNGWGPYERDMSNGEQAAGDGHTLTLNAATYAKGLGVHAASELRYTLNGAYSTFTASIGIDDEVGNAGTVIFQVWDNLNNKLYDSGVMNGSTATKNINVSVAGKNELRLIVTNGGDNTNDDHADWADAKLFPNALIAPPAPGNRSQSLQSRFEDDDDDFTLI